jgi:hypothetical protein
MFLLTSRFIDYLPYFLQSTLYVSFLLSFSFFSLFSSLQLPTPLSYFISKFTRSFIFLTALHLLPLLLHPPSYLAFYLILLYLIIFTIIISYIFPYTLSPPPPLPLPPPYSPPPLPPHPLLLLPLPSRAISGHLEHSYRVRLGKMLIKSSV